MNKDTCIAKYGSVSKAAIALAIPRTTLSRMLKKGEDFAQTGADSSLTTTQAIAVATTSVPPQQLAATIMQPAVVAAPEKKSVAQPLTYKQQLTLALVSNPSIFAYVKETYSRNWEVHEAIDHLAANLSEI